MVLPAVVEVEGGEVEGGEVEGGEGEEGADGAEEVDISSRSPRFVVGFAVFTGGFLRAGNKRYVRMLVLLMQTSRIRTCVLEEFGRLEVEDSCH